MDKLIFSRVHSARLRSADSKKTLSQVQPTLPSSRSAPLPAANVLLPLPAVVTLPRLGLWPVRSAAATPLLAISPATNALLPLPAVITLPRLGLRPARSTAATPLLAISPATNTLLPLPTVVTLPRLRLRPARSASATPAAAPTAATLVGSPVGGRREVLGARRGPTTPPTHPLNRRSTTAPPSTRRRPGPPTPESIPPLTQPPLRRHRPRTSPTVQEIQGSFGLGWAVGSQPLFWAPFICFVLGTAYSINDVVTENEFERKLLSNVLSPNDTGVTFDDIGALETVNFF